MSNAFFIAPTPYWIVLESQNYPMLHGGKMKMRSMEVTAFDRARIVSNEVGGGARRKQAQGSEIG